MHKFKTTMLLSCIVIVQEHDKTSYNKGVSLIFLIQLLKILVLGNTNQVSNKNAQLICMIARTAEALNILIYDQRT